MFGKELFLKKDEKGRKRPTVISLIAIVGFIVCSVTFSGSKKLHAQKTPKQSILIEKDVIEAANNSFKNQGNSFNLDYAQDLTPSKQNGAFSPEFNSGYNHREEPQITTKMIVFDDTKDFKSSKVVPLGSMIKCLLIHNIVTNNFEAPVIVQVWEDFYFDGVLLLPFGTRIYGTASAGRQRDRVTVKFHDIVFQDGTNIKIDAIGLSKDGSGGLTGIVIDDSTKQTIIGMALNLLTGVALGFQQTTTNALTGYSQVEANTRNALLTGVANTFQKQSQQVQSDIEASKGYAIILAGSPCVIYFEQEADVQPS
jgi:type IV secretory pathway VirB10-like protein